MNPLQRAIIDLAVIRRQDCDIEYLQIPGFDLDFNLRSFLFKHTF